MNSIWLALLFVQDFTPPPVQTPTDSLRQAIAERTAQLGRAIQALRGQGIGDPLLAEVQVFHKAATWIVRHNEFYQPDDGKRTLDVLDRGLLRAQQVGRGESPWLRVTGRTVVRAYRSRLDGSVQPFAVTFPASYGQDLTKKWRLDVVLHGRDNSLTEVKFLSQRAGDQPAPPDQPFVLLEVYGRGNNGYRWAGEADVLEALDAFVAVERGLGRDGLLDPARVVMRGFSMGGAGTWHLGLHYPDRWCCLGPGAGFTTTRGYVQDLPDPLPPYQEACLTIYDALPYAENAFNVPVVAYAGDQDPQVQAARNIEARLKPLGISMTFLVAQGVGHRFPPEWQKKAEAEYSRHAAKGREEMPARIKFVTYTLKYPQCFWVRLLGLDRHYQRASIEAERGDTGLTVKTANIRSLRLTLGGPESLRIDDQQLEVQPWIHRDGTAHVYLERWDSVWRTVLPHRLMTDQARRPRKIPGQQGPIDDAFTDRFLCVRGTGQPWNAIAQRHAEAELERFQSDWNKFFRGELPVKDDTAVTDDDLAVNHLILFGDPGSNLLIKQVLDALPLRWTREQITLRGKTVSATDHLPVVIYPSPINPTRYVVLNSGHTFRASDFRGSNARLYPRLGDYALLKPTPTATDPAAVEVVTAGLFDDDWK